MIVTDVKWKTKTGKEKVGFYLNSWLKENLDGIPRYLSKGWDVVGIYTGHGKVRIGKSTKCFQDGYYIAWRLAGGEMVTEYDQEKKVYRVVKTIPPKKQINFNLKDNVVFKPEDLVTQAQTLYDKYGKHQVLIYDEGREGLDSKVMNNINEIMEDFFQKCGFMGHVILIVLPNFFKLHEDYAVARSLYLVDCFTDKQKNRGYFNFYDEKQKEWLYFLGKKRIGITQKYMSANETFWGRFTQWFPFDKEEYDQLKKQSMKRKSASRMYSYMKKQRNALIYYIKKNIKVTDRELAKKIKEYSQIDITPMQISNIYDEVNQKVGSELEEVIEIAQKSPKNTENQVINAPNI